MGTIGDLLGIDLAAAFAQDESDATDLRDAQGDAPAVDSHVADSHVDKETAHAQPCKAPEYSDADTVNPCHEAVLAAIVAETHLEPSRARLDLTLRDDLDLNELGLYAIVAAVEHELRCTFTDEAVRSWQTLGDVLNAADEAGKTPQNQR